MDARELQSDEPCCKLQSRFSRGAARQETVSSKRSQEVRTCSPCFPPFFPLAPGGLPSTLRAWLLCKARQSKLVSGLTPLQKSWAFAEAVAKLGEAAALKETHEPLKTCGQNEPLLECMRRAVSLHQNSRNGPMRTVFDVTAKDVSKGRVCNLINVVSLPFKAISTVVDNVVSATLEWHGSVSEEFPACLPILLPTLSGGPCGLVALYLPEHAEPTYTLQGFRAWSEGSTSKSTC